MHPILASKARLFWYLLAWELAASLLVQVLTAAGTWDWRQVTAVALPMCLLYGFLCLPAWYLCRFIPVRGMGALKLFGANLAAALLTSFLWVWAGRGIAAAVGVDGRYWEHAAAVYAIGVLLYLLAAALFYILLTIESWRQAEAREMQARMLAREAELKNLKAQVNPHFLFNCLHSISALAGTDGARAREMCILLGDFLRSSLGLGERERIPLADELDLARRFLALEKVRLGSRLQVREDVEQGCDACSVPPLVLQPLVENAIRHGIANLIEGGIVSLEVRRTDGLLSIAVENTYDKDAPPRRRGGVGLSNVRKRLEACYGGAARLDVRPADQQYRVELMVPWEEA